jgi:hypothetical protein
MVHSATLEVTFSIERRNAHLLSLLTTMTNRWTTVVHPETFSAVETQRVLPPRVLVQKSVTATLGQRNLLWTGIGDFHLSRPSIRWVAQLLHIPANQARHHTLNPPGIDPVYEFSLLPGMVNPFLPAGQKNIHATVRLHTSTVTLIDRQQLVL